MLARFFWGGGRRGTAHTWWACTHLTRVACLTSAPPRPSLSPHHPRVLPNGNYEVGVHIADVTHFLRPDTAMDTEASSRATTVYLVQRRIDMLPKPLTEDICSLR